MTTLSYEIELVHVVGLNFLSLIEIMIGCMDGWENTVKDNTDKTMNHRG